MADRSASGEFGEGDFGDEIGLEPMDFARGGRFDVERGSLAFEPRESTEGYDLPMDVVVSNPQGEPMFRARIGMWVSPRPRRDG